MRYFPDLPYCENAKPLQKLDLYLPDEGEEFPVFVYFHGGGFKGGDKRKRPFIAEYLTRRGIAAVFVNYRMYPDAKYPDFIEDGAAAVAWVKNAFSTYGKVKSLYVGGSSAGGHLSMVLCFDSRWLGAHGLSAMDIDGFFHDAGQPTCHFNMLCERGYDPRRILVDEAAPLFHVGKEDRYPPMRFIVSDNDMKNRYEETLLMISALENFGHTKPYVTLQVMHGKHCAYVGALEENGDSVFGKMCADFIEEWDGKKE